MKVVKRDGKVEEFRVEKLRASIEKALSEAGLEDRVDEVLARVLREIEGESQVFAASIADRVERVMVEMGVSDSRWFEAAKRYELAHLYNDVYGKGGWSSFHPRDLELTFNAIKVLEARYLLKDPETWRYRETPQMLFRRVARAIASVEYNYGASEEEVKRLEEEFYNLMSTRRFMPNTPTLMNAGTRLGILSACFVIPVRDSMTTPEGEGIMDSLRAQALIHQHGGGTGFDFSELRPEYDVVSSSGGLSSGPLSFMKLFDVATDVVKQGGKRRGANMGIMHVWHADIEKFIVSKTGELKDVHLQNFNISVAFYDDFFYRVASDMEWYLVNPRKTDLSGRKDSRQYAIVRARHYIQDEWVQEAILEELEENGGSIALEDSKIITLNEALLMAKLEGAVTKTVRARELLQKIVEGAWDSGDPGFINIDEINRRHPVWYLGKINATNPCGEEPLLPWEPCNLGSINLEMYVVEKDGKPTIDWEALARDVRTAVRFLDNVIDANDPPLRQIREANLRTRKVGLGVMGWARMLIRLGIPYDSPDAIRLAWHVAEWIAWNAYEEGVEIAREKGPFPAWNARLYRWLHETLPFKSPEEYLRVVWEETGRRDLLEKPSSRLAEILEGKPETRWEETKRKAMKWGLRNATYLSIAPTGTISIIAGASASIEPLFALAFVRQVAVGTFIEVEPLFLEELRRLEMDEPEVIETIAETGSVAHLKWVPRRLRRIFRTAHDIDYEYHLLHQAVWQAWVDAGTSKTINMRHDEPVESVWKTYWLAWRLRIKGTTVYRDRSKSQQVIYFGVKKSEEEKEKEEEKDDIKPVAVVEPRKEEKEEPSETRKAPKRARVRLGKGKVKQLITVAEDYAGGCPTCDI
ncbi:MAG: adenosylcobalamin-dependent ribonucleoside-diphosphate reductase [Desulfurococcales archaeon]|nr:adenosylcobalamin-dependent ribonucleoside-diphosphate reductase [Desulfurococcales archaeon]